MAEFLSKATGTAVEWVQMVGMKVMHAFVVQDSSTDNVLIFSWLLIELDPDCSLVRIPLESSLFRTIVLA
jgi:hypothetical protein